MSKYILVQLWHPYCLHFRKVDNERVTKVVVNDIFPLLSTYLKDAIFSENIENQVLALLSKKWRSFLLFFCWTEQLFHGVQIILFLNRCSIFVMFEEVWTFLSPGWLSITSSFYMPFYLIRFQRLQKDKRILSVICITWLISLNIRYFDTFIASFTLLTK